jgi:aspartate/methionine/tyrosine aminotransferase
MTSDASAPFPYMRWAKERIDGSDPRSLARSGVDRPAPSAVPGLLPAPSPGEDPPERALRAAIARREGVPEGEVLLCQGTSHGNFLVHLAFARGGHVVSETPAYESLTRTTEAVGATLSTFVRRRETGWRVDRDSLRAALRPGTRLLTVTDLHNPTGAALHEDDLALLLDAAESVGAWLLVDEVYREFDPRRRRTARLRGGRVLVTNSLTKVHGLSELRAGWILGPPDALRAVAGWDDLVCPAHPELPRRQALLYLPHADRLAEATRATAAERILQVDRWVAARDDVRWTRPAGGLTGLLFLGRPGRPLDGVEVARRLHDEHGVRAVPGAFFQVPDGLRVSFGIAPEALASSLDALGRTLDAVRA